MLIEPFRSVYQLGDRLNCSADGNPQPIYEWKNVLTGYVIKGGELIIFKELSSTSFFECVASNAFGKESINISFTVTTENSKLYVLYYVYTHRLA